MTATITTTVHMDTTSDRTYVGWISRTETIDEDGRDITTGPISVSEAITLSGDPDRIQTETAEMIEALRTQETERAKEIETYYDGDELEYERGVLVEWRASTDRLAAELTKALA